MSHFCCYYHNNNTLVTASSLLSTFARTHSFTVTPTTTTRNAPVHAPSRPHADHRRHHPPSRSQHPLLPPPLAVLVVHGSHVASSLTEQRSAQSPFGLLQGPCSNPNPAAVQQATTTRLATVSVGHPPPPTRYGTRDPTSIRVLQRSPARHKQQQTTTTSPTNSFEHSIALEAAAGS